MFRVVAPVAVALVLLIAGLLAAMAWLSARDIRANLADRARLTVSMLSHGVTPLAWDLDWMAVDRVLASLNADPDYVGSIVWDDQGAMVASNGDPSRTGKTIVRQAADLTYIDSLGHRYPIGRVAISLQTDRVEAILFRRLSAIAGGGLLALLAICGVLVYIARGLIRPINALTSTMTGLARGDTDLSVPALERNDEIGHMAAATQVFKVNAVALRASEVRYRELLENLMEGVFQMTPEGRLLSANQAMADILGWDTPDDLVAATVSGGDWIYPDKELFAALVREVRASLSVRGFEMPMLRKDRSGITVLALVRGILADGELVRLEGSLIDVSERKRATERMETERVRLHTLLTTIPDLVWLKNTEGVFLACNPAFARFYGATEAEIVGKTDYDFTDQQMADFFRQKDQEAIAAGKPTLNEETVIYADDGHQALLETIKTPLRDGTGAVIGVLGIARDITARRAAEDEVKYLAFHDSLTSLPNRRLLLDRLQRALVSSARNGREGALLFIDLDNFKTLNDTFGHEVGDLLLQQVANRLVDCMRAGDTVARLGGDEFVVLLEDLHENPEMAASQIKTVGEKIFAALLPPYLLAAHEHHSTASIGATLFGEHRNRMDELLKRADIALYQAKAAGRNTLRFFDPSLQALVQARASLEADLRQGLKDGHFLLLYQPQVDDQGRLIGAEALIRWRHPRRGLVSPAEFIPLAEETGLILPLGGWVLETACRQIVAWSHHQKTAHLTLAVNVSARQFHQVDWVEQVLDVVTRTEVDPRRLKLELTESMLLDNAAEIIDRMAALKARGLSFSLDDFGTGYSSLAYLKRLPIDELKIDQSFVRDTLIDPNNATIAKTIIALAQNLGLGVIAEGVETEAQRDFLAKAGCRAFQGYLFSRPVPAEAFETLPFRAMDMDGLRKNSRL
jgi:diguanylate cyclase (GGDEF)-like protein/PAS domain S-box-containing protein